MLILRRLTQPRSLWILLPIGLITASVSGYKVYEENRRLSAAVPIEAEVLSGSVKRVMTGSAQKHSSWEYRPEVRFQFELDGERHESTHVTPLDQSGTSSWAEELVARFPVGEKVPAFVVPGEPDTAFLVKVRGFKSFVGLGVGATIALGAAFLLWRRARTASQEDPATDRDDEP